MKELFNEDFIFSAKLFVVFLASTTLSILNDIDIWLGIILKVVSIISFVLLIVTNWKKLKQKVWNK